MRHQIKIIINFAVLVLVLCAASHSFAQKKILSAVPALELDRYLGVWYEIAHKPNVYLDACAKNTQFIYTVNVNGQVEFENDCIDEQGQAQSLRAEATLLNPPHNSKFRMTFLPDMLRWLPLGRNDFWVLKVDDQYQTALIGDPHFKTLWILSRQPTMSDAQYHDYVKYAHSLGYKTQDLIRTKHTEK